MHTELLPPRDSLFCSEKGFLGEATLKGSSALEFLKPVMWWDRGEVVQSGDAGPAACRVQADD